MLRFLLALCLLLGCADDGRRRSFVDAGSDGPPAQDERVADVSMDAADATPEAGPTDAAMEAAAQDMAEPDTRMPMCTGEPPACNILVGDTCDTVMGCRSREDCRGFPEDCFFLNNRTDCENIEGCSWDSSFGSCDGFSESCFFFNDRRDCENQGCDWEVDCSGTAVGCNTLSVAQCTSQPNCSVR